VLVYRLHPCYDLPLEPSRFTLAFMSVPLATACVALLAAVLHFVSYKLRKTAERKTFHAQDAAWRFTLPRTGSR